MDTKTATRTLASLRLNGKQTCDTVCVRAGQPYPTEVTDPNKDALVYRWELLPESTDLKSGGDRESRPAAIPGSLAAENNGQALLKTPLQTGAYRLFLYASGGQGNLAMGNIPFYMKA